LTDRLAKIEFCPQIYLMRGFIILCSIFGLAVTRAVSSDFHEALKARRDRDTVRLEQGQADDRVFDEVKMINRKFHEEFRTVHLFHVLDEKQPALAKRCFRHVADALLAGNKAERALFLKHSGDLTDYMRQQIDREARMRALAKDMGTRYENASRFIMGFSVKKLSATASRLALLADESGDSMTAAALRRIEPKMALFLD
jgi:hypothetical protein